MGCFNVACSISNISINSGDPIVLIPLEVAKYAEQIGSKNLYLIYSRCFYYPAAFPIKGDYDDYGGIENIEMNEAAKFNEKWYQTSINDLWECREDKAPENITSGMFIHREIYDLLINKQINEYGTIQHISDKETLGSTFDRLVNAIEICKEEYKKINSLTPESPDLDYTFSIPHDLQYSGLTFREYETLKNMAKKCLETNQMKDSLVELYKFEVGMYFVNAFYFPAMNGLQQGNHYMSRRLYQKSLEIMTKKISYYKD